MDELGSLDRRSFVIRGACACLALAGCAIGDGEATFAALSRICPHQGATVNLAGSGFQCPRHGAQFTLAGTWTGGQHTSNLRSYATSYDATTGVLTVG